MQGHGLQNSTAVVTGAGSGIGWQAGLQLAEAGCRILAVDINPEGLPRCAMRSTVPAAQPYRSSVI